MQTNINDYIKKKGGETQETKEEPLQPGKTFAEKMKEKKIAAYAMADKGYTTIWRNESAYKDVLGIMERFSRENGSRGAGAVNAVLIYSSKPDATYFLNFNEWGSKGCYVKKGSAHSELFVQTASKKDASKKYTNVENLFDISQVALPKGFHLEIDSEPVELEMLLSAISSNDDYGIEYDSELPDGYDSLYIPQTRTILLREGPGLEHQAFSILMELGHHNLARSGKAYERSPDNEFAAYSSAYILACRYGLPTENVKFPANDFPEDIKTPGEIKEHLSAVYKMARSIEKTIGLRLEVLIDMDKEDAGQEREEAEM